ncbi:MAG TPA: hypothetical protein VHN55_03860, partial [Sphingomicrobium sp.]|nr:hypothetical protein [Sphingomicrobium sp.]
SMAASFAIPLAALTFPSGRFEPRWSLWGLPLLVVGISSRYWARGLPAVEQISLVVFALLTIAVIAKRYSLLPQGVQRQQVKWAALGFVLFLLLLLVSLALQLADQRTTDNGLHFFLLIAFSIVEALAVLALVGGLLVSLLRYRLYDADAAISRSAVYAALTLSLIAIFAATEKFIEIMGEQYFGSAIGSASGVIAAGFAAVMIAPLHARMSNWAERRFQRNLIRLRRDLPLLVGDLRETVSPERLADIVLEKIAGGVRSSRSALIGVGAEGPAVLASLDVAAEEVRSWMADWSPSSRHDALDCARDDMLFPIRIPLHAEGAGTVGWILLGPRPDGSFYGKDEREALLEIADCVARGISVARRRAERETAHSRATELLTRRVSALESMVKRLRGSGATAAAT